MSYVFGPVLSRRLGRSLGVDVVPYKFCTQDCIYCQLGKTTHKTVERNFSQPVEKIIQELKDKLNCGPDFITIGGSGEPTLCKNLGEIIDSIKSITEIPVAVLTNGSLFYLPNVRKDVVHADVVCPSLDAGKDDTFQKINHPEKSINFKKFIEGLIEFRKEYKGKIWLEIMLIKGFNDSTEEIQRIAKYASLISPDRIHLNTITRPPAISSVEGLSFEAMKNLCGIFNPPAEVIADLKSNDLPHKINFSTPVTAEEDIDKQILEIIQRHPCSPIELAEILKVPLSKILKKLENLDKEEVIVKFTVRGKELYRLKNPFDK
ncbi:MAG: radical SAM protein [Candidatus Hydrogenedentes bacterium]|nr:radical SAM protein [Candidatus Hydrogenedentota bacterium]